MYTSSYLKRYNKCLAVNNAKFSHQTELLISGFINNETYVSNSKKQISHTKIISLMCKMHGDLHMFNESNILTHSDKIKLQKLISSSLYSRNISFKSTKLIYNAKQHGFTHQAFYKNCSNYSNTLILIESDPNAPESNSENSYYSSDSDCNANNIKEKNKIIFGGFTSKQWKSDN
eukprot:739094_1